MNNQNTMKQSKYFRISLTDSCNLSCYFCHNEGQFKTQSNKVTFTAEDIIWITEKAAAHGYTKIKLTGGEPSRHPEIMNIISGISSLDIKDFSMITNGNKLKTYAPLYRENGLHRLNVSLYSLNADKFKKNNGGTAKTLNAVIEGIDAAIAHGYTDLKLNYVWDGADNLDDFLAVCKFAAERNIVIVLLPIIKMHTQQQSDNIELVELYNMLKKQGIESEKFIIDAEGIAKNLIQLSNGAQVLIRLEELKEKLPFAHCFSCIHRNECREGIFPTRLSAKGVMHPCLADTDYSINIGEAIRNRDAGSVSEAFSIIQSL